VLKGKGIISDFQKEIICSLLEISDLQYFYLTGGTALAEFYLGHRRSYDLDIFTAEEGLVLPFSRIAEEELKKKKFSIEVIRRFTSFVEFELTEKDERTKLQFAYDSPFRFDKPVGSDIGIKVNAYKDIIVDKLLAFFGRAEPRDAVDLFFILKKENVWELTELAGKKDPGFDLYWLAVALEKIRDFPDDIIRWPVEMIAEIKVEDLKDIFYRLSREIMERLETKK
jgi:hypothetical protein